MPSSHEKDLARACKDTHEAVLQSRTSCDDGNAHTLSSRKAIDRSLRLLKQPYHRGWVKDGAHRA